MSILDRLKGVVAGREDQMKKGVDKVAGFADEKTKGKYRSKINTAKKKIHERLDGKGSGGK